MGPLNISGSLFLKRGISMSSAFFAMIGRMKYIDRWALMRNTEKESLTSHSFEVAVIAHGMALLSNERLGTDYDADRAAVLGLFHDSAEILTGDMPTPVKYYNPDIKEAYKKVESAAENQLISMLPDDLEEQYEEIIKPDDAELRKIVKAADKISALIKCIEEEKAGNMEFNKAKESTEKGIRKLDCPAADLFMEEFIPAYSLTLDQLQ